MATRSSANINTRTRLGKQLARSKGAETPVAPSRSKQQLSDNKVPGSTADVDVADAVDETADVYEVDEILDIKPRSKNATGAIKYLVSWVGFEEQTWEPAENLPSSMVSEYRLRFGYVDRDEGREYLGNGHDHLVCATCGDGPGGLGSSCGRCSKPMHHFCASDVCKALGLKDGRGQEVLEFQNDTCFCSTACYHDANGTGRACNRIIDRSSLPIGTNIDKGVGSKTLATVGADKNELDRNDATGADTGEPGVYEVEAILDMELNQTNPAKYLVSWVGFTEQTWEPGENLPPLMVADYRRLRAQDATAGALTDAHAGDVGNAVCATCGDGPDGLGSACAGCSKPMHHFCATEVCMTVGLKDAAGQDIVEFPNDQSFCSKACYNVRHGAGRAAKMKRVRRAEDCSESDYDEEGQPRTPKKSPTKKRLKTIAVKATKPTKQTARTVGVPSGETSRPWPPPKPKKVRSKPTPVVVAKHRDPLVGKMVAFCADKEDWMPTRLYKEAMGLFLSGRVFIPKKVTGERLADDVYEVRWTVTIYQTQQFVHRLKRSKIEEGIRNHATISGGTLNKATYRYICQVPASEECDIDADLDEYVILDGSSDLFVSDQVLPENLELVEQIKSLDFQPTRRMQQPVDLFTHDDGTTGTKLLKEKRHHFETASSSFLAYLPVSFWRTVVCESNKYAGTSSKGAAITLDELLRFFGILFYMTINDKGEYSNYWGTQVENKLFNHPDVELGLDSLMSLKRFQYIRKNLSFRYTVTPGELKKDPVARIRPLINMLKYTCTKYVALGRNVAVDESSVACRSKFGRHLIVFNSSKPTGKFHFKIYACCCATSWLMIGFRLHCSSDMDDRLQGVIPSRDALYLEDRLQFSSTVRQIVLEVTQPLHGSKRIVNTDNFYTSVTLLLSLRDVGMYGRGTIREKSAHFPKAHLFAKKTKEPRGSSLQGVSRTGQMIAASWMDGSPVNLISNADSSEMGEVTRLIGKQHTKFPAPKCVAEYNQNMQGVDRLDQLRAKFSLADGHSMKKWHKKLALAFIDIARVNAYVTMGLRPDTQPSRNAHRDFMLDLSSELITGKWKETAEDEGMLFADDINTVSAPIGATSPRTPTAPASPTQKCDFVLSSLQFPTATRGKRGCKVCIYEGRHATMKTNYCLQHNVCLCSETYPIIEVMADVVCPHLDWNCWRKYHDFYLPRGVWNAHGRIKRSSALFQARSSVRRELQLTDAEEKTREPICGGVPYIQPVSPYEPVESPPTLIFSPFDGARANEDPPEEIPRLIDPFDDVPLRALGFYEEGSPARFSTSSVSTDYQC